MPEIHLLQWTVAFAAALYFTFNWFSRRQASRWRHVILGFVNILLWIPVAYTAGNVHVVTDSGETVRFGSQALASVSTFMIVVCIAGILIGLYLWAEEAADDAHDDLPSGMQHRPGRGD